MDISDRVLHQQLTMQPGILLGMGGVLCRSPQVTVRTTVVSLGYCDVFVCIGVCIV